MLLLITLLVARLGIDAPAGQLVRVQPAHTPVSARQGGGNAMPTLKTSTLPAYPEAAVAAGTQGIAELEVVVGPGGDVRQVRIVKSPAESFDADMLDAVRRWQFDPARDGSGTPFTVLVGAQIAFTLGGGTPRVTAKMIELPREPLGASAAPATSVSPVDTSGKTPAGFRNPTPARQVQPDYTSAAMREKVMGTVTLEVLILADGTVGKTRVMKSLDDRYGLDRQAQIAARYWLFEPAEVNGQPVPCIVTLEIEFRLH